MKRGQVLSFVRFPYTSNEVGHLNIIHGDILEIEKEHKGWIRARCQSTGCVGICPKAYTEPYINEFDARMKRIEPEVKILLRAVFENFLSPTKENINKSWVVLDLVNRILEFFPWNPEKEQPTTILVQSITRLRKKLRLFEFKENMRTSGGSILTTHDIVGKSREKDSQNNFPETIDFKFNVEIMNVTQSLMLRVFLYSKRDKAIMTHIKSSLIGPENPVVSYNVYDIDKSQIEDLAIVVRVLNYIEGLPQSYFDYLGVGVEMLSSEVRKYREGNQQSFLIPLYKPKDGLFGSIIDNILDVTKQSAITQCTEIQSVRVHYLGNHHRHEAKYLLHDDEYTCIRYPINVTRNYGANILTINICNLKHKTKLKATRVVCRVIDLLSQKNEYIPCFLNSDKTSYVTIPQKGSFDMPINEETQIYLDSSLIPNPEFTFIVFFVERANKPPSESRISSFTFFRLLDDNQTMYQFSKAQKLKLIKAKQQFNVKSISEELILYKTQKVVQKDDGDKAHSAQIPSNEMVHDYCITNAPSDTGYLEISSSVISLVNSANPVINSLISGDNLSDIESLDNENKPTVLSAWGFRVLVELCKKIVSGDTEIENRALGKLIELLSYIDKCQKTYPFITYMLDDFNQHAFTGEYGDFQGLGIKILGFISNNFKEKITNWKATRTLALLFSIIVESMKNSKKQCESIKTWEETEKKFIGNLTSVIGDIINGIKNEDQKLNQVIRGFLIRAIPFILKLMFSYLKKDEIIKLINNLIKGSNEITLIESFCKSEIFHNPEIRKEVLPTIVKELKDLMTKTLTNSPNSKTTQNWIELIQSIFFSMRGTSLSFSDELEFLVPFIIRFLELKIEPEFSILFLYFASTNVIKKFIQSSTESLKIDIVLTLIIDAIGSSKKNGLIEEKKDENKDKKKGEDNDEEKNQDSETRPEIFFALVPAFTKIFVISQDLGLNKEQDSVINLISLITNFYSKFLARFENFKPVDRETFSSYYSINLSPIAKLLPLFIQKVPKNTKFDKKVFVPLFHMYVSMKEDSLREPIKKAFGIIVENEKNDFKEIEQPIIHALMAIMSVSGMIEITSLFESSKLNKTNITQINELVKNMETINPQNALKEEEYTNGIFYVLDRCERTKDYSIYPHFSNLLYQFHLDQKNFVEAGETLDDCAKVIENYWPSSEYLEKSLDFDRQLPIDRVKAMLHKAFDLFMQAQFFERAAQVAERIRNIIVKTTPFEYDEIAAAIDLQQKSWESIVTIERTGVNRFYGVEFFGDGFDELYKDKKFVYRRGGYFDNGQMMNYMRQKFPKAEVSPRPPSEDDKKKDYIYMFNVKPRTQEKYYPEESPPTIMIRSLCYISDFFSEIPVRVRIESEKYNEIAEYHRHITYYQIDRKLQGISRRGKVVKAEKTIILTPIECAIIDTNAKSLELLQKASSYWRCLVYDIPYEKAAVSSFSMLINGIVNAAVNGGTKLFQDLFLVGKLAEEENNKKWAPQLREAFVDQLKIVHFSISIHEYVVADDYRPLHNQIKEQFAEMKNSMKEQTGEVEFSNVKTKFGDIPQSL